jgi:steroid delta-isomerase-like uncharacterized protein
MRKLASHAVIPILTMVLAVASQGVNANTVAAYSDIKDERKTIEKLFAAWNFRDVEKVMAVFANEAVYDDAAAGQIHRGKNEIREWVAGAFRDIENFKIEVTRSSFYKGGGIIEWVWSGTDKGLFKTGKSFSVRGVSVVEVRRGKVEHYTEYYDFATVMRQLGLLPAEKN